MAAQTPKNRWWASGGACGLVRVRRRRGAAAGQAGSSFGGSARAEPAAHGRARPATEGGPDGQTVRTGGASTLRVT